MERKLATVLFVDLVDSTSLVAGTDPEVARRRVTQFFERASRCIRLHGGTVEKYAGDAVMAAFGIPVAHEDDAERAARAALAIMDTVDELGLKARAGVEAGEVVADSSDSTFATGEAVNVAARLQQAAAEGQILIGPAAHRLTLGRIETEDVGPLELRGLASPVWAWSVVCANEGARRAVSEAPLVGRDSELELLENTFARCVRDRRAALVTVFGDPGVGKSRLAREFAASLDDATVFSGRCLPYGEGVTYWSLAEMVKASAGIRDDEPAEEALEKLRATCEIEAVADLLGLISGILAAVEGESSQQELAWAARAWAEKLAEAQPLLLVFEDVHWAEEPLLDLIEHLAAWIRDTPVLILCLARPDLLDVRPHWGGGRLRAATIDLEPLSAADAEELVDALLAEHDLPADVRELLLEKTEGNPLFVEETIRILAEDADADRIPDTLQALIAARIDHLPPEEKTILQRAAALGRIFYRGALENVVPELADEVDALLQDLILREFLVEEQRSNISGEHALRFKHVLIREVAYGGLSKWARAELHEKFARWLEDRAGEELLEIRAYHLDQAASLHHELDGAVPPELAAHAATTLERAAKRAIQREAFRSARKLALRAVELEPKLFRSYLAARAAWRVSDYQAVVREMEEVRAVAHDEGDAWIEGMALTALGEAAMFHEADIPAAQHLLDRAIEVLGAERDPLALFEATRTRAQLAGWRGDAVAAMTGIQDAFAIALAAGRKDLQTHAALGLAEYHVALLELDEAETLLERAVGMAEETGSIRARASAAATLGVVYWLREDVDRAEAAFEEARRLYDEVGASRGVAWTLCRLGQVRERKGDSVAAEKLLRESLRILRAGEVRSFLCEAERVLAELLVRNGRVDEAEEYAVAAVEAVSPYDTSFVCSTTTALALVRAAQGRDVEAETGLRDAVARAQETGYRSAELQPLRELAQFLRARGRDEEAEPLEERLAELGPAAAVKAA